MGNAIHGVDPRFSSIDSGTLIRSLNRPNVVTTGPFRPMLKAAAGVRRQPPWPAPLQSDVFAAASTFLLAHEANKSKPYWPGKDSGVTWGIGYDAGYHKANQIRSDWSSLPAADLAKLALLTGLKGASAHAALPSVAGISVPKKTCIDVFETVSLPDCYCKTKTDYPGLTYLPKYTQVALTSMIYNRGPSFWNNNQNPKHVDTIVDKRWEVRHIAGAVLNYDLPQIARLLLGMIRLVNKKTDPGLFKRRKDEAALVQLDISLLRFYRVIPTEEMYEP